MVGEDITKYYDNVIFRKKKGTLAVSAKGLKFKSFAEAPQSTTPTQSSPSSPPPSPRKSAPSPPPFIYSIRWESIQKQKQMLNKSSAPKSLMKVTVFKKGSTEEEVGEVKVEDLFFQLGSRQDAELLQEDMKERLKDTFKNKKAEAHRNSVHAGGGGGHQGKRESVGNGPSNSRTGNQPLQFLLRYFPGMP